MSGHNLIDILIESIRSNNTTSFINAVCEHRIYNKMLSYALYYTRLSPALAKDAVSNVVEGLLEVKNLEKLERILAGASEEEELIMILLRQCKWAGLKMLIRENRTAQIDEKKICLGKTDLELTEEIQEAIDSLPMNMQELIQLRFFEGWTCATIAHRLQMSRRAVTNTINEALKMLRDHLLEGNGDLSTA